ncbi:MAG: DUF2937 family protein [Pseudomonadota bacterium]
MSWMTRKADNLGSAASGGVGGIGLSQAPAFTQAYLQRLGGHIDEARLTVEGISSGATLPWLAAEDRSQAAIELSARVAELEQYQAQIEQAPAMLQPFMLLRHGEWSIAERAIENFTPAIPLDPASLLWTAIGVVAALVVYELIKAPAALFNRQSKYQRS